MTRYVFGLCVSFILLALLMVYLQGCTVVIVDSELRGISIDTDNHDDSDAKN